MCVARLERDLPARYDQMGVEIRERIKWDIREAIVGAENFLPKHLLIATWKNVSFVGGYNALETVCCVIIYRYLNNGQTSEASKWV